MFIFQNFDFYFKIHMDFGKSINLFKANERIGKTFFFNK